MRSQRPADVTTATAVSVHRRDGYRADSSAISLRPRSMVAIGLTSALGIVAFAWPLFADADSQITAGPDGPWLFALLVPLLLAVVLAEIAEGGLDAKAVALLGVLTALGAALRPLSGGVTGFQPMFVVIILAGRVFGPGFGFVLGSTSMLASALLTGGVGPWLPFQMLAAAWLGLGAGLLPRGRGWWEVAVLAGYGVVGSLVYGVLLNLWFWPFIVATGEISYVAGAPLMDNLGRLLTFSVVTSLGFDIPRAIGCAVLITVMGRPALATLRRTQRHASFGVAPTFATPPQPLETLAADTLAAETPAR